MELVRDKTRVVVLLALPALLVVSIVLLAFALTDAQDDGLVAPADGSSVVAGQAAGGGEPPPSAVPPVAPAETASSADSAAPITITAVGDIVVGSQEAGLPPKGGAYFDGVRQTLSGDVVLGNLETTLSEGGTPTCEPAVPAERRSVGKQRRCVSLQAPPAAAGWLRDAGFTVLNLANNHTDDYGPDGVLQTRAALEQAGLSYTGMPGQVTLQKIDDAVVAVVGFAPDGHAADVTDIEGAQELVRRADAEADVVVVTMHAGAEGPKHAHVTPGAETYQGDDRGDPVRFAHAVIDAGADLVVGHGPQVLRGLEWYKDRLIAYSLGSFGNYEVFDRSGPRKISGILKVRLAPDGTWVGGKLVPTYLKGKGLPALDPDRRALGIVRGLSSEDFGSSAVRAVRGKLVPPGESGPTGSA